MGIYRETSVFAFLFLAVVYGWVQGFAAPVDRIQGEVFRIIYCHVPVAAAAFYSAGFMFVAAIMALVKKNEYWLELQKAAAESGLLFTALALVTGSIWGRPTFGIWWTWDARLTTTLLLALLLAGYLLLYSSTEAGPNRLRICSILAILISFDVPIIYKSVEWYRTLHQPAALFTERQNQVMSTEITDPLILTLGITLVLTTWLITNRRKNIELNSHIETLTFEQMRNA